MADSHGSWYDDYDNWDINDQYLYDNLAVSTHLWKLKRIPDPDMYSYYFSYANYKMIADAFKASLTHLVIEIRPRVTVDYNKLKEFSQLISIRMEFHVPANMLNCLGVLDNTPHLESLEIQCEERNSTTASPQVWNVHRVDPTVTYPNIKKLHIQFLKPVDVGEIQFIH